jgi:hypothetical protein
MDLWDQLTGARPLDDEGRVRLEPELDFAVQNTVAERSAPKRPWLSRSGSADGIHKGGCRGPAGAGYLG